MASRARSGRSNSQRVRCGAVVHAGAGAAVGTAGRRYAADGRSGPTRQGGGASAPGTGVPWMPLPSSHAPAGPARAPPHLAHRHPIVRADRPGRALDGCADVGDPVRESRRRADSAGRSRVLDRACGRSGVGSSPTERPRAPLDSGPVGARDGPGAPVHCASRGLTQWALPLTPVGLWRSTVRSPALRRLLR